MAKFQISTCILVLACTFVLGQQLVKAETCSLEMGCTPSDFDCWYDCKHKYQGGHGGCTNKNAVMRPSVLPNSESGEYCCHCLCKFDTKDGESCPKPSPPTAEGPGQDQ